VLRASHPSLRVRAALAACALACAPLALAAPAHAQVSALSASQRSGQVFLTWTQPLGSPDGYRVWRSESPIASELDLAQAELIGHASFESSLNVRETQLVLAPVRYRIDELAPPLGADQGLFVHTVGSSGPAWYAVTRVVSGLPLDEIALGENALLAPVDEVPATPAPVLQAIQGQYHHYVHWVSDRDTPFARAQWNRNGFAFNLRVGYDAAEGSGPRPVLVRFHFRGANYKQQAEPLHPEAILYAPDDWVAHFPINTYWYGANEAFPDTAQYARHPNVDYTVRRVRAELEWLLGEFPCDARRVYTWGASMGASGAAFFALTQPELVTAAHVLLGKFDFACQANGCWFEPWTGDALWGTPAQNYPCSEGMPTYDRLSLAHLAALAPELDRPHLTTLDGRADTITGWSEKPPLYAALQQARQSTALLWDDGTHLGPESTSVGEWAGIWFGRYARMWELRSDQALPAFTRCGFDGLPGNGNPSDGDPIGAHNGCVEWEPSSIVDTPSQHALECRLIDSAEIDSAPGPQTLVDWTARRLQQFPHAPGQHAHFRNRELGGGELLDARVLTADALGRFTALATPIRKAGNRYELEPIDTSALPQLVASGLVKPGGKLSLIAFGSAGEPAFVALGTAPAAIALPPFSGVLGLADPQLLGSGVVKPNGRFDLDLPLSPALAALVGFPFRFQALVGFAFTPVVVQALAPG